MSDPADEIEARFENLRAVGSGAFGEVFRAHDRQTGRDVAIKRLRERTGDPHAAERFAQEAALLACVDSPHVVRLVTYEQDETGAPCLVLDWIEGEEVSMRQRRQPLTVEQSVEVVRQAAIGLDALHTAGIIHRDVKPSNFFVRENADGTLHVTLIDLGIARFTLSERHLTVQGALLGTPVYMSPEQARGDGATDARSDLFSLGVVLFELLAGRRPFVGSDPWTVLAKIVLQDAPRLSELVNEPSPDLEEIVARALARSPADRFASAREFAAALATARLHAAPPPAPAADSPDAVTLGSRTQLAPIEKRLVTTVFASTPHGDLSPDEVQALSTHAAARGGITHRLLRSRVIAIFGLHHSRGDEVICAANTALAVARIHPTLRLAISTSRILAGTDAPSADGIERGVAQLAGEGAAIRIDEPTARLLGDRFDVQGDAEPYVLGDERSLDSIRAPRGQRIPTVGRDRECAVFDATLAECVEEPVARAVLVTGPAGIGKTRLRNECFRRLRARIPDALVLLGRGSSMGGNAAFAMLAPAIREWAEIHDTQSPETRRKRLHDRLAARVAPDALTRVETFLGEMIRVPFAPTDLPALQAAKRDANVMADSMRAAFEDWLAAECAVQPVVLVFEDLQWGDRPSVRFAEAALRNLADRPLLVVGIGRPEVHETFPKLWAEQSVQEVRLGPLTRRASQTLVTSMLGERATPEVIERILARAEGNPFHLEELVRAEASGRTDAMPETLLGMIQERLDRCSPEARRVLRVASVLGNAFWPSAIADLVGGSAGAESGPSIAELERAEMIQTRNSSKYPPETEYVFRNSLVREAAYSTLADLDRSLSHARAAIWLERHGCSEAAVVARQFELGHQHERAVVWYRRAAEQALEGADLEAALAHTERAVTLGAKGELLGEALAMRAEIQRLRGDLEDAQGAGRAALPLLPAGSTMWYRAMAHVFGGLANFGRFDELAALVPMWADAPVDAKTAGLAIAAGSRGGILALMAGHDALAARIKERVVEIGALAPDDPLVAMSFVQWKTREVSMNQDIEGLVHYGREVVDRLAAMGNERGRAMETNNLANAWLRIGMNEEAEATAREAMVMNKRLAIRPFFAHAQHLRSRALARLGDLGEAMALETEAARFFDGLGDARMASLVQSMYAELLVLTGQPARAENAARRAIEQGRPVPACHARALAVLASILLADGRTQEALAASREAFAILQTVSAIEEGEAIIRTVYGRVLRATGDDENAERVISEAVERVMARAAKLANPTWRSSYLERVPDNANLLALVTRT